MINALTFFSAIIIFLLNACDSTKKLQITKHSSENTSMCDKTVRYIVEKIKMVEGGNEVSVHTEIIFNPTTRIINLKADDPERGKISFDTEIDSFDCTLNEKLTAGKAIYKGYIKQPDGSKDFSTLTIEIKDEQLYIKGGTEDKPANFYMIVDKWEILDN